MSFLGKGRFINMVFKDRFPLRIGRKTGAAVPHRAEDSDLWEKGKLSASVYRCSKTGWIFGLIQATDTSLPSWPMAFIAVAKTEDGGTRP